MATAKKTNGAPSDVMGFLNYYLVDKAPFALPKGLKDFLVKYAPIFSIVIGVFSAFGAFAIFGVSAVLSPFVLLGNGGANALGGAFLGAVILAVIAVMYFMAYPGLKARKLSGWTLLFYIETLNILNSLLDVNIINALVGGLIGYYILFQIRSYYKK